MSGPQMDIPVGQQTSEVGWSGLQIKDILEKIDLFNVKIENSENQTKEKVLVGKSMIDTTKLNKTVVSASNPEDAYLGPKLWDKPISIPESFDETDFSIMNIDDFLSENNLSLDESSEPPQTTSETASSRMLSGDSDDSNSSNEMMRAINLNEVEDTSSVAMRSKPNIASVASQPQNEFLYAESKRARLEREREERKRQAMEAMDIEFAPEDLALATVPGAKFDPKERVFSRDELKPQPIIRKRKKQYVAQDSKDDKYWEKRIKNNVAARRSREARRLKENQIALRAAFLEKENMALRLQMEQVNAKNEKLVMETKMLSEALKKYE